MKKVLLALILTTSLMAEDVDVERLSQAFGHLIGRNIDTPAFSLDLDAIVQGMRDAAEGKPSPMTDNEYAAALGLLQQQEFEKTAQENLESAETFLTENLDHQGVVEIESGLQYQISQEGSGEEVAEHSMPVVHYTGRYIDGTVFGSSVEGDPINLPLDESIAGFAKGVVGMKEGEKRTIFVHPDLGYGKSGHLPPNSLLVFEVEVISAGDSYESADSPERG